MKTCPTYLVSVRFGIDWPRNEATVVCERNKERREHVINVHWKWAGNYDVTHYCVFIVARPSVAVVNIMRILLWCVEYYNTLCVE